MNGSIDCWSVNGREISHFVGTFSQVEDSSGWSCFLKWYSPCYKPGMASPRFEGPASLEDPDPLPAR